MRWYLLRCEIALQDEDYRMKLVLSFGFTILIVTVVSLVLAQSFLANVTFSDQPSCQIEPKSNSRQKKKPQPVSTAAETRQTTS